MWHQGSHLGVSVILGIHSCVVVEEDLVWRNLSKGKSSLHIIQFDHRARYPRAHVGQHAVAAPKAIRRKHRHGRLADIAGRRCRSDPGANQVYAIILSVDVAFVLEFDLVRRSHARLCVF